MSDAIYDVIKLVLADACLNYVKTEDMAEALVMTSENALIVRTSASSTAALERAEEMFEYVLSQGAAVVPTDPTELQRQLNAAWDATRPIVKEKRNGD